MFNVTTASPSPAMTLRSKVAKASTAAVAAALAFATPFVASAQAFGTAVKADIDAAKPELWIIGGGILALCVIGALVNRGKSVTK